MLKQTSDRVVIRFLHNIAIALLTMTISVSSTAKPTNEKPITAEQGKSIQHITWPEKQLVAVSLSYDDALDSHLDNALPALNRHGLRASFYLTLASPVVRQRLEEWRAAAKQGHELGNHSLFHGCSKSEDGRDWVADHLDLSQRTITDVVSEIRLANDYLFAIDGKQHRTFTPPCGDIRVVNQQSFLQAIEREFVAIKGYETELGPSFNQLWAPVNVTAEQLIAYVEHEGINGGVINIIFHGVGGDHLSVSTTAHNRFLAYLAKHKNRYWVMDYVSIMEYINGQKSH
ncbi:polysaccharide deacetylase family protein [Thalassotalea litorea]|uniref:polysaccharide deacetylase family protein n=1 Tax=Thalassotalea litorea TaxID=2020715 RepID=UPI003736BE26